MKSINIGLMGLGTVGSGVYKLISRHKEELEFQVGCPVRIKKILVNNLDKTRMIDNQVIPSDILTDKAMEIINDDEIQIIIEVIGGEIEARDLIISALKAKKNVVTANKDVIASSGVMLNELAVENGCDLFYEASVAGGIPVIRGLTEGLASDNITHIMGIVNGTTNYILTKMSKEGMDYDEALKKAQELGFAEPDPTSDVEGLDAARKMVILSSLGFSMPITLDDVYTRGITEVTKEDIEYSDSFGYEMKLIGYAGFENGEVEVGVQPMLLPKNHPLASVNNENNAVYLIGEAVGETMFYGPGAGAMPTATAIVSDVIASIKRIKLDVSGKHMTSFKYDRTLKDESKIKAKFYLRLDVKDQVGVLKDIATVFTDHHLSFESVIQKPGSNSENARLIIVTHEVILKEYMDGLKEIKALNAVNSIESSYRVVSS